MGIKNLQKFLDNHIPNTSGIREINVSLLADKAIAIDISIYLYQYACAIKDSVENLVNKDGEVITHVQAIIVKALGFLKKKIKPIFVFDGTPPEHKNETLSDRNDKKKQAKNAVKEYDKQIKNLLESMMETPTTIEEINEQLESMEQVKALKKKKITASKQTVGISKKQMNECKELLRVLGIPVIEAPSEADPQCMHMVNSGNAYAVASEDMDILTFGTKKLIRKLTSGNKCRLYDLDIILRDLDITHDQFIDICILLGCDYTGTLPGLGLKRIYRAIKDNGNIEGYIAKYNVKVPETFDYVTARECFKNPDIINVDSVTWNIPDYNRLSQLLKEKYSYSHDEVDRLTNILRGGYYSVICGEKTIVQYRKGCNDYIRKKELNMMDSDED